MTSKQWKVEHRRPTVATYIHLEQVVISQATTLALQNKFFLKEHHTSHLKSYISCITQQTRGADGVSTEAIFIYAEK